VTTRSVNSPIWVFSAVMRRRSMRPYGTEGRRSPWLLYSHDVSTREGLRSEPNRNEGEPTTFHPTGCEIWCPDLICRNTGRRLCVAPCPNDARTRLSETAQPIAYSHPHQTKKALRSQLSYKNRSFAIKFVLHVFI